MFASKGIVEHLVRGGIGFGALALAGAIATSHPFAALALFPVALVALRGCPMCWTMGLVQTVMAVARGRRPRAGLCIDGSCARPR